MFDDNVINLTLIHPWMTFEEAHLLIKWSYYKNMSQQGKFGDNSVKTLMSIDYGMFQWQPREWIEERIEKAKNNSIIKAEATFTCHLHSPVELLFEVLGQRVVHHQDPLIIVQAVT